MMNSIIYNMSCSLLQDVIGKQVRMGGDELYPQAIQSKPQPFDLPIIYQDDHFAIGTYCTPLHSLFRKYSFSDYSYNIVSLIL